MTSENERTQFPLMDQDLTGHFSESVIGTARGMECWILCCGCGTAIQPNAANMCLPCIRQRIDITENLVKQISVDSCRSCERFLSPPLHWVACTLESKELLGICLKKCKFTNSNVKLIDAGFLWTEPHSKRLKVKITVQKEILTNTVLQQTYSLDVLICHQQCPDCQKVMAKNTWKAVVQVRQKVDHKRTFLYLEQLILKHHAHRDCSNIKSVPDGLDFFFLQRPHALSFVEFLNSVVPMRSKTSEQLISQDTHSGTANYKFTFSVEMIPLCKEDLLCLPEKVAKSCGSISQIVLVSRVGSRVHLLDPSNVQTTELPTATFWRSPFSSLCSAGKHLVPFVVLDVEECGKTNGKYVLADIQVARVSDLGRNDNSFHVKSHLGRVLKPGDTVLGYDLVTANLNQNEFNEMKTPLYQDIILVKKCYSEARKKKWNKNRTWKLKYLAKEVAEDELSDGDSEMNLSDVNSVNSRSSNIMTKKVKREAKNGRLSVHSGAKSSNVSRSALLASERETRDLELFLQDLEEDPDLRSTIHLYKSNLSVLRTLDDDEGELSDAEHDSSTSQKGKISSSLEEDNLPEIDLAELLDDLSLSETSDYEN